MLYPSERHAKDLCLLLSAAVRPGAKLTLDHGTHRYRAKSEANACEIVCFDTHSRRSEQGEARYYIVCLRWVDGEEVARHKTVGRSSSPSQIVAAVVCWLEGQTVEEFHEQFPFIGRVRRFYIAIEEGLLRYSPELSDETTRSLDDLFLYFDRCEIWFTTPSRSCCICPSRYGDDFSEPRCVFYWNGSRVPFAFPVRDLSQSAQILKRWLCDNALPSQLRVEFPWLAIGTLADHYEAGQLIEGDFLSSWDDTERHYWGWQFSPTGEMVTAAICAEVLEFIADIRRAGFDRTLRGGISLIDLIVSRSRYHGLRNDQPSIRFEFRGAGIGVYADAGITGNRDRGRESVTAPNHALSFPEIKFTPAVAELLRRLEAEEIN